MNAPDLSQRVKVPDETLNSEINSEALPRNPDIQAHHNLDLLLPRMPNGLILPTKIAEPAGWRPDHKLFQINASQEAPSQ